MIRRTRLVLLSAAIAAFLSLPAAAPAQLSPGYSGFSGIRYMGQEEVWWSIRQLGDCLARTRRTAAIALLATTPGTAQETAATRALLGNNTSCLQPNSRMRAGRDVIRASVAEGLYRRNFTAPPPAQRFQEPEADAPPLPLLVDFASCYVQTHPAEAHNLLAATRLGSREEHEALRALAPTLGQCLAAGVRFEFPAPLVRLALAEALYQRARRLMPMQQQGGR
jgi:hypothetical protein